MKWTVVGLGNPGQEYEGSRHNVGRDTVSALQRSIGKRAKVVLPNVYMNNSGAALRKEVASSKSLIVVQDELDLPLGSVKISFGSSSGGHRGVGSIIKALKTQDFVRIRVGISPATPKGALKRPDGKKVVDFVLGQFKPAERTKLKKAQKMVAEALELLFEEGVERAQTEINSR